MGRWSRKWQSFFKFRLWKCPNVGRGIWLKRAPKHPYTYVIVKNGPWPEFVKTFFDRWADLSMSPKQSPNLLLKKETKGGRKNLGFSRMKDLYHRTEPLWEKRAIVCPKPSLKIRTASAIFWIYLGIFSDNGLKNIFLGIKLFCFSR